MTLADLHWTIHDLQSAAHDGWDGLIRSYKPMWERLEGDVNDDKARSYHLNWIKDVQQVSLSGERSSHARRGAGIRA